MIARPAGLPLPLDLMQRVATGLGAGRAISLEPASLLQAARQLECAEDFGDPSFEVPLELLVRSLEQDADLHVLGRIHLRDVIVRALRTRLRLTRLLARRPHLAAGPPQAPLIVCGLPRTGTTLLHRLLAALPTLHGLPLWKLVEPIPPAGPDRRLAQARRRHARLAWVSGRRIDAQHLMAPELPEECGHLFRPSFMSPSYAVAPALGYLRHYPDCDARPAYREYRALLGLLAEEPPVLGGRLVLKDPFHALFLDALYETMPGAMVVQTHRDPQRVVPSLTKLLTTAHGVVTRRLDMPRVAGALQDWLQTLAQRSVDRASEGRHPVYDLDYRALVADPIQTVETLHHHFGLPFDPAWRTLLQAELDAAASRLPNRYTAAAYGLDPDRIDKAFAPYVRQFL